jgi:uncharacterized protein YjbI with pentapeptide repeats
MKQQKRRTIGDMNSRTLPLCNTATVCYTGLDYFMLERRWQQIKIHPVRTVLMALLAVVIILIIMSILGYIFNWDWTGLNATDFTSTPQNITRTIAYQPGKTLWDWLQLLIIPAVLAVAGYIINLTISRGEQAATEQRAKSEREAVEKRAETERAIAKDNQREAALQAYINEMSELLLEKNLRESTVTDEVRTIAHVRTLTVLPRLDGKRKRNLLQFLYDAGLIDRKHQIIDISDADLSEADLWGVILYRDKWIIDNSLNKKSFTRVEADLSGVDLRNANLNGANLNGVKLGAANETQLIIDLSYSNGTNIASLCGAKLVNARLCGADLGGVDLHGADLSQAILGGAYLMLADLSEANLHGADLSIKAFIEAYTPYGEDPDTIEFSGANLKLAKLQGANLTDANLTDANLSQADLSKANLGGANLQGADLREANLTDAIITPEQLKKIKSLKGATMRDGSIHD